MSDWRETTWGELVELKYGKSLSDYKDSEGEFPVYGTNGPIGWCDAPLCNSSGIIIGRKGAYRGVHFSDKPFYVIDTAFFVVPKVDVNIKWAYYQLLTQDINGLDSGSAIPSTSREDFYQLLATVPPRMIQDAIVIQLDSLQAKIELNRQINRTLEEMAQAIFKSWFVNFDPVKAKMIIREKGGSEQVQAFAAQAIIAGNVTLEELERMEAGYSGWEEVLHPLVVKNFEPMGLDYWEPEHLAATAALFPDALQDSDLGPIPDGWAPRALEEFFPVVTGKKDANYATDDGSYPFFTCSQAQSLFAPDYSFEGDAILLAGNGDFNVKWYRGRFEAYQRTYVLIPFEPKLLPVLYFAMKHFLNDLTLGHKGSVINYLTKGMITGFKLALPANGQLLAQTNTLGGILTTHESLSAETKTLAEIRDSLLPKLLSGEISVTAADAELEDVYAN